MKKEYYVIDVHAHISDSEIPIRISEKTRDNPSIQTLFEGIQKLQRDVGYMDGMVSLNPTSENFKKLMKESGTDFAILSQLGFSEYLGEIEICPTSHLEKILPDNSEYYWGFAGIDPRSDNIEEQIEYYIKEKGFKGIRINPNDWGEFSLDSEMLVPFFEKCSELSVPIHFHTGVDPEGLIELANPMLLDKVAIRYPNLLIFLEHYGFPFKYEAYAMCRKHDNVYLTLAWHFNKLVHHNKFLAWLELEEMRVHAGINKIMYGSDYPATPNNKEVIDFIKFSKMPLALRLSGVQNWSYEWRAKVLGLNVARVLKINNPKLTAITGRLQKTKEDGIFSMEWTDEALQILNSIPAFVRKGAIQKIESYAKMNGHKEVTAEIMTQAKNHN